MVMSKRRINSLTLPSGQVALRERMVMPRSAPRPCTYAGCAALVYGGSRCAQHQYDKGKSTAKQRQQKRAMNTGSSRWRRIRKMQLSRQPLCVMCQAETPARITPATVVDHIDGDSHNNHENNLTSMCASHHAQVTARHDGGFGNEIKRR